MQEHLLIRSDRGRTGYKGVHPDHGRYKANCDSSPCHRNHLGMFVTPEEAAQAYLQHREKEHPEELEKVQQMVSAVEAVAQCNICFDTMTQASTVSGCGHTFCRSCTEESVTGCCPECHVPARQQDTIVNDVVQVANAACTSAFPGAILLNR